MIGLGRRMGNQKDMGLELKIMLEAIGFALVVLIVGWGLFAGWRLALRTGRLRIGVPQGMSAAMAVSGVILISTGMWASDGPTAPLQDGGQVAPVTGARGPGPLEPVSLEASGAPISVASTFRGGAGGTSGLNSFSRDIPAGDPPPGDEGTGPPAPGPSPGPGPGPGPGPTPSPSPTPSPEPSPSPDPEPSPSPSEEPPPSPPPGVDPCDFLPPPVCP